MRTPVVLDINPDPEALDWEQDFLGRLELPVITCRGPLEPGGCPLLKGNACGKIEAADGVLFQLNLDLPDHRHILGHYIRLLDVPIRAVVTEDQKKRWAKLLDKVEVFTPPIGPAKLDAFAAELESETD